jgi:GT2 family glycosyltransferase
LSDNLPRVFTVIPNWNLKGDLAECLDSLFASPDPAHEVVVVDNASTDGSLEMLRSRYPQVHLLALDKNLGYAGGLNVGYRFALAHGADFVFGINNDIIFPPGSVRRLVETAVHHPRIGLLSPKVVYASQPNILFSLGARQYPWAPLPLEFGHRWQDGPRFNRLIYYDYVTGCAMLMPAAVLRQVGLMDVSFFMHYEDNDFCRRIRDAGFLVAMDGQVTILHKAFLSTGLDKPGTVRRRSRNGVWFSRRYRQGPAPFLTALALFASTGLKAVRFLLARRPDLARAVFAGFWEGWRQPVPPLQDTQVDA